MANIDISNLDLDQLTELRDRTSERINMLRAEAAAAFRLQVEREAERLGISVRDLVNGSTRRRSSTRPTPEESESSS